MSYTISVVPSCKKDINSICKKNTKLRCALEKKLEEIAQDPARYKPLRYGLSGARRVHLLKSFVLVYSIDGKEIRLLKFAHHDDAYRR